MDVKFVSTTSIRLPDLPIVSGQLIYLSDTSASFYDIAGRRILISGFQVVTALPDTGIENIIYGMINNSGTVDSYVWDSESESYHMLSGYVATANTPGIVQPDGTTITIDANGVITAAATTSLAASSVTYDNSTSNLSATDAQAAIDEIVAGLGTAAAKNVPVSGDASDIEVVLGDDTRLTDARPASDVYEWAKASSKPSYAYSEITNTPTLGTAAAKDVPTTGNASTTQVVMGDDTRLTDSRNAADVYDWAKASTKPSYSANEISGLGTAAVANTTNTITQGSNDIPTAGAVWSAIDNLPEPMVLKGTLGTGGTITTLPTAAADNEGFTYKVITDGTYAGQAAKVGDFFVSCKPVEASAYEWIWFPSGDDGGGSLTDTWRNVKINGTEQLGSSISTGAVDFIDGTNTTVAFNASGNKISVSVPAVSSSSAGVAPQGAAVSSQDQSTKFLREDGSWAAPSYTTNTDANVAQNNNTTNAAYRLLLSASANNTDEIALSNKSDKFQANPSTGTLQVTKYTGVYSNLTKTGTGTAAEDKGSGVSPRYFPAKWTYNLNITPVAGDTILITNPVAGHSYGVYLSTNNGTNYYPIVVNGTTRLTNEYPTGTTIALVFDADGSAASMFPLAGGDDRVTVTGGVWRVINFYVGKVSQTNSTASANYRLLLSASASDTNETNTSYKSTNFQANPSTGLLTVKQSKSTVDKSMLTGTGTEAQDKGSGVSPRYFPAKWTFNTGITVADGDMFTIKIPVAGSGYGEFISVNNGTNYYPVGYNTNSALTTHFPVGAIITVVFKSDGQVNSIYALAGGDSKVNVSGGAFYVLDLYDSGNSNTYDRNRYQGAIKVWGTALVAQNIIVANTSGLYIHLKQNAAFDITYPILYLAEAVAASGTTSNTYDIINFATATTQSGTWTAYKPVFIKGQLSGTTFTPVSATPLTQTIPTTADGYEYILLGIATATTTVYLQERHPIYAFRNGQFGEIVNDADSVNGLTVQTAVPANAVFTDAKVTQTATTTNANYEVLFSVTADNTTRTEGARKNSNLKFNPSTGNLTVTSINGLTISLVT